MLQTRKKKKKRLNQITDLSPNLSIITLKVNAPNTPRKYW